MLTQHTLTRLRNLKLDGMARGFEEQLTQPANHSLAFEERFGLLVDREIAWRDTRRLERLLKLAHLKFPNACVEDLDDRTPGKSTIITSQLPVAHWHEYLAEPTLADAILDRLVHHSHRIDLKGETLRGNKTAHKASKKS